MGKKQETAEGWDNVDEFIGAGDLTVLSDDGDSVQFAIVGAPFALRSTAFKGESKRVLFPIFTDGTLSAMPVGARVYRKITKHQGELRDVEFILTRRGVSGDTETRYELRIEKMRPTVLDAIATITKEAIHEVLTAGLDLIS